MLEPADASERDGSAATPLSRPARNEAPSGGGFYLALVDLGAEMDEANRLRRRAMYRLRRIVQRLDEGAQETARRHNVHPTDLHILMILYHANAQHEGKVSVIQRALRFTAGGMTRRLDSMVERDLLRRVPDPRDGRSWLAQLTQGGVALAAQIHVNPTTRRPLTGDLSSAEWQSLGDLLGRIGGAEDDI